MTSRRGADASAPGLRPTRPERVGLGSAPGATRPPSSSLVAVAVATLVSACAAPPANPPAATGPPRGRAIAVSLAPGLGATQAGRLLVFARKVLPGTTDDEPVDSALFRPDGTAIAAREVADLRPGTPALVDGETDTFPAPFSTLAPGTYRFQAVLDRDHRYNYSGRGDGDLVSPVVEARLPGPLPALTLDSELPAADPEAWIARLRPERRPLYEQALAGLQPIDFPSRRLSAFWGRPVHIRGWIALPPGYAATATGRWPTVYADGGFGSTLDSARRSAAAEAVRMATGVSPPMIWVVLDHSVASGTHEFADSANNGPWGAALTDELIPALDARWRTDARAAGRFLTGHSSGGWSALWLQVRYPKLFGGAWPTSPDPADFHDFSNVDLYAPDANLYTDRDGRPIPLMREGQEVAATQEESVRLEEVLGARGGQFSSFEWVYSPRGEDGRPLPLFDRKTGRVDPQVARYWIEHYDIAHILERDWNRLGPDLDGKIHLTVGTADSFYLDQPARRLQAVLDRLGARSSFRYLEGKTHFDLYSEGDTRDALNREIAREMRARWEASRVDATQRREGRSGRSGMDATGE